MSPEEQIDARMAVALEDVGRYLVETIQFDIDVAFPPSSEPDTPPHRRSGRLQAGIHHDVDQFHDGWTLTVTSDAEYSVFLRDGTERMAERDFMGAAAVERYTPIVVQRLQAYFPAAQAAPIFVQAA